MMKLRDADAWNESVANNTDPYGKGVMDFSERWADLMEQALAEGSTVADVAEVTSHTADTEGITGFMYGCAVQILSHVWEHGEELRRWHNLDTQIHDEGEKANAKPGAVLNPALLNVSAS